MNQRRGRQVLWGQPGFAATLAERERALGIADERAEDAAPPRLPPMDAPPTVPAETIATEPVAEMDAAEAEPVPAGFVRTFASGEWNERGEGLPSCYGDASHWPEWAYHLGYQRLLCMRCHAELFPPAVDVWHGLRVYRVVPEHRCQTCEKRTWGNLPGVGILCWTCKSRVAM